MVRVSIRVRVRQNAVLVTLRSSTCTVGPIVERINCHYSTRLELAFNNRPTYYSALYTRSPGGRNEMTHT